MQNKKNLSWGSYFKEKGKDIKNNLYRVVDTANNLGVKAPVTDWEKLNENIPVDNEGLEEDQTKIDTHPSPLDHQEKRHIRSINTNSTFAPDLINLTNTTFAPDLTNLTNSTFAPDLTNRTNTTFAPDLTNRTNTTFAPDLTNRTNSTFAPDLTNHTTTTSTPDVINNFKLSDEDNSFIEKELESVSNFDFKINEIRASYGLLLQMIADVNYITKIDNKDFLNYITNDIVLMARGFTATKQLVNHAFFIIENKKGRLGFPGRYGIKIMDMKHFDYIEYIINNLENVTRTLKIGVNILNQYPKHYQELFKNYFNKNDILISQAERAFPKSLSFLKAINSDRLQNLDRFLDNFILRYHESVLQRMELLGIVFRDRESTKACLKKINKKLFSKKFPNFDLYKAIDSLDNDIEDVIKNFKIMYNKLISNETINIVPIAKRNAFFEELQASRRSGFTQPSKFENVLCVNPDPPPQNNYRKRPTLKTTLKSTPRTSKPVHTTVESNYTYSTEIIALSLLAFTMFAGTIKLLWKIYYEFYLAARNADIEMTRMPQEDNEVNAITPINEQEPLVRSNILDSGDPAISDSSIDVSNFSAILRSNSQNSQGLSILDGLERETRL